MYYRIQSVHGVEPWYWYVRTLLEYWTGLGATMFALCAIGAVWLPQPFVTALLIAGTYSIFGHKEFRFIYPTILLVVIVSGIGLAQVAFWIRDALYYRGLSPRAAAVATCAAALWFVILAQLSLSMGSKPYHNLWIAGRDMLMASRYTARLKSVCGIGIIDNIWFATRGYASLHHAVPLYWATPEGPLDPDAPAFNTVVYDSGKPIGVGYVERACFGQTCVAQRHGNCLPAPMTDMSAPPRALDTWKTTIVH